MSQNTFCSWCEGQERSKQLTAKGMSGGYCEAHYVDYLLQLALAYAARGKQLPEKFQQIIDQANRSV